MTTLEFGVTDCIRAYPEAFNALKNLSLKHHGYECLTFWIGDGPNHPLYCAPKEQYKNILGNWIALYRPEDKPKENNWVQFNY